MQINPEIQAKNHWKDHKNPIHYLVVNLAIDLIYRRSPALE